MKRSVWSKRGISICNLNASCWPSSVLSSPQWQTRPHADSKIKVPACFIKWFVQSKDYGCSKTLDLPLISPYVPYVCILVCLWFLVGSFSGICSTPKIAALTLLGVYTIYRIYLFSSQYCCPWSSFDSELHSQVLHRQLAQSKCLIDRLCVVLHHFDGKGLHRNTMTGKNVISLKQLMNHEQRDGMRWLKCAKVPCRLD